MHFALFMNKSSQGVKKNAFLVFEMPFFVENALFLGKFPFVSKIKLKSAPFKRSMPSFSSGAGRGPDAVAGACTGRFRAGPGDGNGAGSSDGTGPDGAIVI